jgi:hypothetical protein
MRIPSFPPTASTTSTGTRSHRPALASWSTSIPTNAPRGLPTRKTVGTLAPPCNTTDATESGCGTLNANVRPTPSDAPQSQPSCPFLQRPTPLPQCPSCTPMDRYDYMRIRVDDVPKDIFEFYKLKDSPTTATSTARSAAACTASRKPAASPTTSWSRTLLPTGSSKPSTPRAHSPTKHARSSSAWSSTTSASSTSARNTPSTFAT